MLVHLRTEQGLSRREAAQQVGYSRSWARRWWRRYRAGGAAALQPAARPAPGALATLPAAVAEAVLAYRRTHPRIGAERALVALQQDPALARSDLPSARTIHRAWGERAWCGPAARAPPHPRPPRPCPPMSRTPSGRSTTKMACV